MGFSRAVPLTSAEVPFELTSVEQVEAPKGSEGPWQRYVISQGTNTIVGMRGGLDPDVRVALGELVGRLNLRLAKRAPPRRFGPRLGKTTLVPVAS